MIWSLATAGGIGPLFHTRSSIPGTSPWNASWLMMGAINQSIAGIVAGITNGSDFSRYARDGRSMLIGR